MMPIEVPQGDGLCVQALDHLAAMVRVWTPDHGVVYVNRPWLEATGTTTEANRQDGWLQSVPEEDRPAIRRALEQATSGTSIRLTYRVRHRDGREQRVVDSARAWVEPGTSQLQGLVHTCMSEQVDPSEAGRTQTMSKWAHELRGSLNAILGWSDLLAGGDSSPEIMQRGLKAIADNARQQATIIRRMSE
ncbi:MAG: PAS domain-containing protein [Luteitalea sp.]|jgi:PAS domain S-box-containing protein|nr:PAS domain-containing protein [Acidobacteriota bacterium]